MNNSTGDRPLLHLTPWEQIQLHPSIILFCVLLLGVGVPGNSLILYIYTRRININICGFFIKTLAVLDLINSICIIPAFLVSKILPTVNASLMCKYLTLFHNFSAISTGVLYVVIAVQRYKKICRPHRPQFTETFAKKLTVCCIIFSFVSGLPILFILTNIVLFVEWGSLNVTKFVTVPICDFTETSKRMKLSLVFSGWLFLVLFIVITNLFVFYSLIGRHLRRQTKNSTHHTTQGGNRSSNITKMFFILALIFLITIIPRVLQAVYFSQTKKLPQLKMQQLQIIDFIIQLPYLNCVVNPFVYGFSSKRFRSEVKSAFSRRNAKENPNIYTSTSNTRICISEMELAANKVNITISLCN